MSSSVSQKRSGTSIHNNNLQDNNTQLHNKFCSTRDSNQNKSSLVGRNQVKKVKSSLNVDRRKPQKVSFETIQQYQREFGIDDPAQAQQILGFAPNKETVTPIDFDSFKADLDFKRQKLAEFKLRFNYQKQILSEVADFRKKRFMDLYQTCFAYKNSILEAIIRIQRWWRKKRQSRCLKEVLSVAMDLQKERLRNLILEIEGEINEEQLAKQQQEQQLIEANNQRKKQDAVLKGRMMAERKAKALIMFEKAFIDTVPIGIGGQILNVLNGIKVRMYFRTDHMDQITERKEREFKRLKQGLFANIGSKIGEMQREQEFLKEDLIRSETEQIGGIDPLAEMVGTIEQKEAIIKRKTTAIAESEAGQAPVYDLEPEDDEPITLDVGTSLATKERQERQEARQQKKLQQASSGGSLHQQSNTNTVKNQKSQLEVVQEKNEDQNVKVDANSQQSNTQRSQQLPAQQQSSSQNVKQSQDGSSHALPQNQTKRSSIKLNDASPMLPPKEKKSLSIRTSDKDKSQVSIEQTPKIKETKEATKEPKTPNAPTTQSKKELTQSHPPPASKQTPQPAAPTKTSAKTPQKTQNASPAPPAATSSKQSKAQQPPAPVISKPQPVMLSELATPEVRSPEKTKTAPTPTPVVTNNAGVKNPSNTNKSSKVNLGSDQSKISIQSNPVGAQQPAKRDRLNSLKNVFDDISESEAGQSMGGDNNNNLHSNRQRGQSFAKSSRIESANTTSVNQAQANKSGITQKIQVDTNNIRDVSVRLDTEQAQFENKSLCNRNQMRPIFNLPFSNRFIQSSLTFIN